MKQRGCGGRLIVVLSWGVLLELCSACSKPTEPSAESKPSVSEGTAAVPATLPSVAPPVSQHSGAASASSGGTAAADGAGAGTAGVTATAGATGLGAGGAGSTEPGPLSCSEDAHWETASVKALKSGVLQVARDKFQKMPLRWEPCGEARPHCERLALNEHQRLLAVGAAGNSLKPAVTERCGDKQSVVVAPVDGKPSVALRGIDIEFQSAALGGDRFLLGGVAKHKSDKATLGYVLREYLVTGREAKALKLEAARNKLKATPDTAASQFVHVKLPDGDCTTMFWKLGVGECDFYGPHTDQFAMLGANMIYVDPQSGKGMAWDAKQGSRELLPILSWILTDGVNVVWAAEEHLYTTQPRWDLPALTAKPARGNAGAKPVAIGCGRLLNQDAEGWSVRNITRGTTQTLSKESFPVDLGTRPVMNCDWVVFSSGYRVSLKGLGPETPVAPAPRFD